MAVTHVSYTPAQNVTVKAQGALSASTFVTISADVSGRNPVVKTAAAGNMAFGVPAHDVADGGHVMVYRSGHIVTVAATGSLTAGDIVAAGSNGKAVKLTEGTAPAGVAVSTAADGFVQVALG
ncbi:capsid cement protein [Corynebacterium tapiri]|uniref:DUF2190 family protein n=1 Tax=Corynebacterium tapiri TaxID=1448266 RepID=A0A5C4U6S0_9CORY|nr:capsid cement protein [Corynebacterium tapiri]TNL98780.1 hypothetical protein FHE74_03945 [Corynebacterium tapiri]